MTDINTEILSKIKKLLDLTDSKNNATQGEIDNATAMAHKLLAKHHLTMSQVMAFDDDGNVTDSNFFELKELEAVTYVANKIPVWMELLVKAVNKITQTKTLIKRKPRPDKSFNSLTIIFVGDIVDVSAATELFTYLRETVTGLSTKHAKQYEGKFKYWRSFANGCCGKILSRSEQIEQEINKKLGIETDPFQSLSVDSQILNDDDDYEDIDEDEESEYDIDYEDDEESDSDEEFEINNKDQESFSIELYNKYKENKYEKIREYIENQRIEEEKASSTTARIEAISFSAGSVAGEKVSLRINKKLGKNKRS